MIHGAMPVEVEVKKWGNSLAVILPKDFIEKRNIREKDRVSIEIIKEADLSDIFGTLETDLSAQEIKDEARKGW